MDDQDERIASIFYSDEVPEVTDDALKTYLQYIKDNLDDACEITGIEDFEWEEYYFFGPGSKKEHEKLRKTREKINGNGRFVPQMLVLIKITSNRCRQPKDCWKLC